MLQKSHTATRRAKNSSFCAKHILMKRTALSWSCIDVACEAAVATEVRLADEAEEEEAEDEAEEAVDVGTPNRATAASSRHMRAKYGLIVCVCSLMSVDSSSQE